MVGDVVKDMADNGEEILEPIACKRYSRKFMVRVPTEIHRNLAIQALESGVQLGSYAEKFKGLKSSISMKIKHFKP